MVNKPPAITGKQLIRLLRLDGWEVGKQKTHGVGLRKSTGQGRTLVTIVPNKREPLSDGTLAEILGPLQTGLGRDGLIDLIERYGIK